jgi:hypothetical protein
MAFTFDFENDPNVGPDDDWDAYDRRQDRGKQRRAESLSREVWRIQVRKPAPKVTSQFEFGAFAAIAELEFERIASEHESDTDCNVELQVRRAGRARCHLPARREHQLLT